MNCMLAKWRPRDFLVIILFLQFIVYVTVFFDAPIASKLLDLSISPSFRESSLVKLLKLNELDGLETVLFSAGLSVAFLMLSGIFIWMVKRSDILYLCH
jgi:uncharacterized membrane protein